MNLEAEAKRLDIVERFRQLERRRQALTDQMATLLGEYLAFKQQLDSDDDVSVVEDKIKRIKADLQRGIIAADVQKS